MNYQKIYYEIINQAQNSNRNKSDRYYEAHHIIPRCLGGCNSKSNLVLLTPREHFLAHWLLLKIHPTNVKLRYAFTCFNKGKHKRNLTSKQFERTKLELRKMFVDGTHPFIKDKESHTRRMVETRKREGTYRTGSDNIFSSEQIKQMSRERMLASNPMKHPSQKKRMQEQNPNPHQRCIHTPIGVYASKSKAVAALGLPYIQALNKLLKQQPHLYYIIPNN